MSEVGNMIAVFRNGWRLCRRNDTISFGYIILLFVLFISGWGNYSLEKLTVKLKCDGRKEGL